MKVDWMAVAAAIGVFLYFLVAVGIVLARRGLREQATRALTLYAIASFLWEMLLALWRQDQFIFTGSVLLERAPFFGIFLLALLFLHLSRSFLRLERVGLGWWALGVALTAGLVILDGNMVALPQTLWFGGRVGILKRDLTSGLLILGWAVFMGGTAILTARTYRQTQQPLHRNRITYWPLVLGAMVISDAMIFIGQEALGSGFRFLGMLVAAYVVFTYRLPDVRRTMRRTASYLIITLLTVIIYTAGFLAAQYVFQSAPVYNPLLVGAVLALILAILFQPLLRLIQRLVDRFISGVNYDPGLALREYSLNISNVLDLERLAMAAVGIISEVTEIQRGALFLVHRGEGRAEGEDRIGFYYLRGVRGMGEEDPPPGVLSASSPVADYLCREHRPLTQYDIDLLPRFREASPAERDWLASLDMDVYVPIYTKDEWIGLLALGPKVSGDQYFENDLVLLSTLADQTAVALENARLFDDLKVRNVENEHLNEELAAANRELSQLDQAKSDFINVASHELRTPLTQVRGYSQLLNDMSEDGSLTSDMAQEMTDGINKATERLQEIIETMFMISRIDTQTLSLDPSETPVAVAVKRAVDVWASALEERKQILTVEGVSELPPIIADGKRLQQVFSHLVQNAIKYTPNGGQIRIIGRLLGKGMLPQDQTVEIVVADTGIGISAEDRERIFDKFYRADDTLLHSSGSIKFKGAGPGLGLTIARGIVEAHGGRIWVESPGYDEETFPGSQFHVVLPVLPRHLEAKDSAAFIASIRGGTG